MHDGFVRGSRRSYQFEVDAKFQLKELILQAFVFVFSMAESVNAQIHGYSTSCRKMTELHFDFFLIVMFGMHNDLLEIELAKDGYNPRSVLCE